VQACRLSMLPSLVRLSSAREEGADFVSADGHVVASLRRRSQGQMALIGVRRGSGGSGESGGTVQMSAPLESGVARVEYGGRTGKCATEEGVACTRLFLRSAHNRGHATVLIRNGYMVGRFNV